MRLPAVLAITLVVLVLSGCRTPDPVVIPAPEPTSTPLFASDEEALAAAEEAYAAYLAVVDLIYAEAGADPERLSAVATEAVVEEEVESFADAAKSGNVGVGSTTFDSMSVQSSELSGISLTAVVVVYVCEDFSGTDVLDISGHSIVSPNRQTRWPLTVTFAPTTGESTHLVVADIEDWTGDNFCD